MSRVRYNYNKIGKGIEFFEIRDTTREWDRTHIVRVEIRKAMPFYIGSLALDTIIEDEKDKINKTNLYQFAKMANKGVKKNSLNYSLLGKKVMPMWISNGTFFGDDCFRYGPPPERRNLGKISHSWMTGAVVSKGRVIANPPNLYNKNKRSIFLQRFNSDRTTNIEFKRQTGYFSAESAARAGWSSAIGGGGTLVEAGIFHGLPLRLPLHPSRFSNWWWQRQNGMFSDGQTYCAGPVIAMNKAATCLYLIMDRTNANAENIRDRDRFYAAGRRWEQMSLYLANNFLSEINRTRDGSIEEAIVYDGGGSRGLWIRDYFGPPIDSVKNMVAGYYGGRPIPQYICLWGQAG